MSSINNNSSLSLSAIRLNENLSQNLNNWLSGLKMVAPSRSSQPGQLSLTIQMVKMVNPITVHTDKTIKMRGNILAPNLLLRARKFIEESPENHQEWISVLNGAAVREEVIGKKRIDTVERQSRSLTFLYTLKGGLEDRSAFFEDFQEVIKKINEFVNGAFSCGLLLDVNYSHAQLSEATSSLAIPDYSNQNPTHNQVQSISAPSNQFLGTSLFITNVESQLVEQIKRDLLSIGKLHKHTPSLDECHGELFVSDFSHGTSDELTYKINAKIDNGIFDVTSSIETIKSTFVDRRCDKHMSFDHDLSEEKQEKPSNRSVQQ